VSRASKVLSFCYLIIWYCILHHTCIWMECCFPTSFCSALRPIKMTENIVIKGFLDNPYFVHPLHSKLIIMNKGRPTQPLPNVIKHHKTKTERYTRHFCVSRYGKVDWLSGGETANKLYCWPCLFL
jgi:hypothetical protein